MKTRLGKMLASAVMALSVACSGSDSTNKENAPIAESVGPEASLRRLTAAQYERSVKAAFGNEVLVLSRLPTDPVVAGSVSVGASEATISSLGVEQYEKAAFAISDQIVAEGPLRDRNVSCEPSGTRDDDCAREVLGQRGRLLFRRELTDDELTRLVNVSGQAADTLGNFYEGLSFGIAGLLVSPHFLFRVETGEDDPTGEAPLRYSKGQLASRLSYLFWNTTPDDELLESELTDPVALQEQAERLLADSRSRAGVRAFFTEYLHLDELDDMVKDPATYVHWDENVGPAAKEETLRLIEHLVFEERADLRTLFTTRKTFLNPKLASMYAVPAPARDGFGAHEFEAGSPRAGILTHASLLMIHSHAIDSSPTLRGHFIRTTLLCEDIPPPPPTVDTSIPAPSSTAVTLRERLADHVVVESCQACHVLMDPLGFGLEHFDALGRFRQLDEGAPIDSTSDLDGAPFQDAVGLGQRLRSDPRVPACLVRRFWEHAVGAEAGPDEEGELSRLYASFASSGYRLDELLLEIARSRSFRTASRRRTISKTTPNEEGNP